MNTNVNIIIFKHRRPFGGGGGGFLPQYDAYLAHLTTQGYALPSAGKQTLQNDVLVELNTAGRLATMDSLVLMAQDGDVDAACTCLLNPGGYDISSLVGAVTFTANQGLKGDGISAYAVWDYNPSTPGNSWALHNACMGNYLHTAGTVTGHMSGTSDAGGMLYDRRSVPRLQYDMNYPGMATFVPGPDAPAVSDTVYQVDLYTTDNLKFAIDGVVIKDSTRVEVAVPTGTCYLFCRGDGPISFYDGRLGAVWAGAHMDGFQASMSTIIHDYMSSL